MNRIKHLLLFPALAAGAILSLGSCDDVSSDDRYIDMGAADVQRCVLLEDFTGQDCVNCPKAHQVIESLEELYGDNLIAVSVHGGSFGIPVEYSWLPVGYVGLASPEGIAYNNAKNLSTWPAGEIDRRGSTMDYDKWADAVRTEIERPAEADITLSAAVTADGKIEVRTTVTPRADYSGTLQLWVLESGIVAAQKDDTREIPDYVHNNVLRAAINGTWGEPFSSRADTPLTLTHSIPLRDSDQEYWNPANLSVVAFLYNSSSVAQAAKVRVTPL